MSPSPPAHRALRAILLVVIAVASFVAVVVLMEVAADLLSR